MQNYCKENIIVCNGIKYGELVPNTAYLIGVKTANELAVTLNKDNLYEEMHSKYFYVDGIISHPNESGYLWEYDVSVSVNNDELKTNINLNSSYIQFNNGYCVTMYELLNCNKSSTIYYMSRDLYFRLYVQIYDDDSQKYIDNIIVKIMPNK